MPSISGTRPALMGNPQQPNEGALLYGRRPTPAPDAPGSYPQPTPDSGGGGYPQPVGTPAPRGGSLSGAGGMRPGGWQGYRDWWLKRKQDGGSLGNGADTGGGYPQPTPDSGGGGYPQPTPDSGGGGYPQPTPDSGGGGYPQPIDTAPHGSVYVPAYTGDIASGWGVGPTTSGTGLANSSQLALTNW